MAPWCNRLERGSIRGRDADASPIEPNFRDGTAIHGQVFAANWREIGEGEFAVRAGGDWWPWPYEVASRFTVTDSALDVALRLTNLADDPMPAGLGLHPWFARPVEVAICGGAVYPSNLAHQGAAEPVAGRFDRRVVAELPVGLDATWTALAEPPIELRWPGTGLRAILTFDAPARFVAAASPDDIDAIAIEPQTHAPWGLRRLLAAEADALRLLAPGEALELSMGLEFAQDVGSTRSRDRNV